MKGQKLVLQHNLSECRCRVHSEGELWASQRAPEPLLSTFVPHPAQSTLQNPETLSESATAAHLSMLFYHSIFAYYSFLRAPQSSILLNLIHKLSRWLVILKLVCC